MQNSLQHILACKIWPLLSCYMAYYKTNTDSCYPRYTHMDPPGTIRLLSLKLLQLGLYVILGAVLHEEVKVFIADTTITILVYLPG